MKELHDFFIASAGAAAAFIGLLFVAISVAPERVFGEGADARKNARALSAFIALVNVFLISLLALLPYVTAISFVIIAGITMIQTLRSTVRAYRSHPERRNWRTWGAISVAIYALEIVLAVRSDVYASGLVDIVIGLYIYALITAWNLLDTSERNKESAG